ncbi:alpha-2-macroglobulin family protein [Botrimarina mediterranea]|uniref:MG2 domain protein n=1 Tax=Botrimarina mediterranea TaxID=2528022 RepID=A0A518K2L0_9BACT|nr:alpha-2-macroglobulin family protein [Botrimarina mediterranea]QDV72009.1 MG2 domain protein [Botrimarina mediterranea]
MMTRPFWLMIGELLLGALLVGGVLLACVGSTYAEEASRRAVEDAMKAGHWDEALQLAQLRLDSGEGQRADLQAAAVCLQRLNRAVELDDLVEKTVARYEKSASMLLGAMEAYANAPHFGVEVAGEFRRGPQRDGGAMLSVEEADRVRVLRLGERALAVVGDDDALAYDILHAMQSQLMASRMGRFAWRLQLLTDLDADLPDPTDRWNGNVSQSDPPVTADGDMPLLYEVPDDWQAAKNDGERMRWLLAESARRRPDKAAEMELAYADFLHDQFGVQSLAQQGWFRPAEESDGPLPETSALAVETLGDEETIARLATGVRRFTLPEGHRFIEVYRKHNRHTTLADIYLNRNQRPKAAEATRAAIKAESNRDLRDGIQQRLDQLIDPWVRFEPTVTHAAGDKTTLRVTHRNAAKVQLLARRIDVAQLLTDVKALLGKPPIDNPWRSLQVENLGWRLVQEDQKKYLGEEAASWTADIPTPADHRDGEAPIDAPLTEPGAYLVTATPIASDGSSGAPSMVVVWVADTTLVRKTTAGGALYQVLDARDGQPIAEASIDLFGYRQVQEPQEQGQPFRKPRIETTEVTQKTDANGLATFDVAPPEGEQGYEWLAVATTADGRMAYLGFAGVWRSYVDADPPEHARTFFVTDRPVYRPGDAVQFKAWIGKPDYLAAAAEGEAADPSPFAHKEFQVDLFDARGEKIETQRLTADAFGGVVGQHLTTDASSLGVYRIEVAGFGSGNFRVEEYRKPEFEVIVDAPEEPTKLGDEFEAVICADYYAGTPVRGGTVKYKVVRTKRTEHWLPPMPWDWLYGPGYGWLGQDATWRSDWSRWGCFGPAPPWLPRVTGPPEVVAEGEATLDAEGVFRLPIETKLAAERYPNSDHEYQITAEVTDAGRRTIVGAGEVLAARKPVNVTVWLGGGYYNVGDTVEANVSVRRPDGKPIAGEGELRLMKIAPPVDQPQGEDGEPTELVDPNETLVQSWRLETTDEGRAEMRLKASEPGQYRLVYRSDAITRPDEPAVEGGVVFTIRGPGFDGAAFRFGDLELVPDKSDYQPGETLRLMVNTDRLGSVVTLFVRPVGGVYAAPQVLVLDGKSTVVEVPIERADMPNFYVEAHTVSSGELHTVTRNIAVPPESRVIHVEAAPSATTYLPGEEGTLRVKLTVENDKPVTGAATIAVYDRSVEAIAGGPSGGDIRAAFWDWTRQHWPGTTHNLSRSESPVTPNDVPTMQDLGVFGGVVPRRRGGMLGRGGFGGGGLAWQERYEEGVVVGAPMAMAAETADAAGGEFGSAKMQRSASSTTDSDAAPVAVRQNFADTAVWIGSVSADAEGFAIVPMPLPESLTSWKIRVWAVGDGLRVGQGDAQVVTRKDLMVRLRAPRFLVERDEATLSALVQNESPEELTVRVKLEEEGGVLTIPSVNEQTVTIAAGAEKLVDWRVTAAAAGDATLRVIATSDGTLSDAMQVTLPVLIHGAEIVESFSGVIGPKERLATFQLVVPQERRPESTRLEVRFAPTLVGAMLDTLPYLIEYPHGCTEQTLNRFLPAVIVRQTVKDLGVDLATLKPAEPVDGPTERPDPVFDPAELDKIVRAGVQRLTEMQLSDGGWGWFSGLGEHSSPHTTAVVARGLGIAKRSGVSVSDDVLNRGLDWLERYRAMELEALANVDEDGKPINDQRRHKLAADNLDALVELVLGEAGRPNDAMLGRLFDDRLKLAPYNLATLGLALHLVAEGGDDAAKPQAAERRDVVIRNLRQFVQEDEENQTAYLNLPDGYWWRWYGSEYEAHAYFLKLLAATEPKGELAPKLVKYLLANRRHATRWNSTRDTALVVEAMADYVRQSGEAAVDGTVEVWLDGKKRDLREFTAKDALRFDGRFVLAGEELDAGRHTLEVRKSGEGRLYVGAALTNFSLEDDLRAAGLEVRVKRRVQKLVPIEATAADVDARGGVLTPTVEEFRRVDVPNLGAVKTGELVEVELTITSKNDYEYLVIEDAKPAGFEPVESQSGYNGNALGAYVEFRDETVRFYARTLARGERTVRYRLRAETPGKFAALPAQISAMYAPELRGNSDEIRVVVEDSER